MMPSPTPITRVTSLFPRPQSCFSSPHLRRQFHVLGVPQSAVHTISHTRDVPGRRDARPLHGVYARENVDVVTVFFVHRRLFRRPEPRHPAKRAVAGRAVPSLPTSGHLTEEGGKERALSSVLTSADPIPEADARRASDVAPTETKSRNVAGDGRADVVKEETVP